MIGFYNYSVILTYIGMAFSVFGMTQALSGHFKLALLCLVISGGCDMFDGKIARSMKNRTEDEKRFGIQIDSLCDLVCFGVFPAVLGYAMGLRGVLGTFTLVAYVLAAVIRLGYFNVMEEKRQDEEGSSTVLKYYQGLPVTSISILFPLIFLMRKYCTSFFIPVLNITLLVIAILFISNVKIIKPGNKIICVFVIVAGFIMLRMFHIF